MKILHLLDIPWWSGLSSYAFDCVEAQMQWGHQVQIACQEGSLPYKKGQANGWDLIPIGERNSIQTLLNFFKIMGNISKERPHLLIAHTGSTHSIAGLLAKLWNIPLIRTRATSQPFNVNFGSKILYDQCEKIILPSEKMREDCIKKFPKCDKKKFQTIYPSIKTSMIKLNSLTAPLKVGMLARLDPVKGHTYFLKAAKIVQEKIPNSEFHLAGSEENISWSDLAKEIKENKLNNCFYHGFLREEEVIPWLESCAVGVIASIGSEEISRAALEWMAVGRPIVATRVGSLPELVDDSLSGYLIPPKDSNKMAEKLLEILNYKDLSEKMCLYNLERAKKLYSAENAKNEWKKILDSISRL